MATKTTSGRGFDVEAALISAVEFLFLLGLWMMFVSLAEVNEVVAGVSAALMGAIGDAIVKATDFAHFRPKLRHVLLIVTEPWYVLTDTLTVFWALARRLVGLPSTSELVVIPFAAGGDDVEGSARRALAIAYTTISPNWIVVGIDRERNYMLVHQISPSPASWMTKQLGARQ